MTATGDIGTSVDDKTARTDVRSQVLGQRGIFDRNENCEQIFKYSNIQSSGTMRYSNILMRRRMPNFDHDDQR